MFDTFILKVTGSPYTVVRFCPLDCKINLCIELHTKIGADSIDNIISY